MKKVYLFRVVVFFIAFNTQYHNIFCQAKITYVTNSNISKNDFQSYLNHLFKLEYGNLDSATKDSLFKSYFQDNLAQYFKLASETESRKDTLVVYRDKNVLYTTSIYEIFSLKTQGGKNKVNLSTLEINRHTRDILDGHNKSRIFNLTDERLFKNISYSITSAKNDSLVHGLKYRKIIVEESFINETGNKKGRVFVIWATKQIKPAMPVYGVLWFHKVVLSNFTPLVVEETNLDFPESKIITTAIKKEYKQVELV